MFYLTLILYLLQKLEEVEWMRYGLQVGACLGPDFGLWLTSDRPGAYLLQNSFVMLIKSLTRNTFCYEINIAQVLSGKVACTGFGEFSVYKRKAWHRTQVSGVENARGLHADPVMQSHGSLLALLSGPAPWLFTLHLYWLTPSVSLELTSSLSSKPVCSIVCPKFPVKWCECVPCWNWLLLPSAVFHLCTISQTLPHVLYT